MARLRALFFDIDDTLYSTSAFAAKARANSIRVLRRLGVRLPQARLTRELEECITEFSSNYEHHFDKLLQRIPRRSWEGVNPAILVAGAVVAYHQTKVRDLSPFPDVRPCLLRLARTRLIRGVVSAGLAIKQAEKLLRLGLYPLFTPTAIFISDQVGISKPNPKIYLRACEECGVAPEECLYVGDSPLADIDPPNAIGMKTVRVRRPGKYFHIEGRTSPTHEVSGFAELHATLRRRYGVRG
ncbi:MAG: HAD-IA family hydrolase [Planctomycetes bacterium]|nr:HAD-IA family hydrolase [Planctomycetota bacterium]